MFQCLSMCVCACMHTYARVCMHVAENANVRTKTKEINEAAAQKALMQRGKVSSYLARRWHLAIPFSHGVPEEVGLLFFLWFGPLPLLCLQVLGDRIILPTANVTSSPQPDKAKGQREGALQM